MTSSNRAAILISQARVAVKKDRRSNVKLKTPSTAKAHAPTETKNSTEHQIADIRIIAVPVNIIKKISIMLTFVKQAN